MNEKIKSLKSRLEKGLIPFGQENKIRDFIKAHEDMALSENQAARDANEKEIKRLSALSRERHTEEGFQAFEQLNELRVETISNYITGSSNAMTFFRSVDLGPDEQPVLDLDSGHVEVTIECVGDDGSPVTVQVSQDQSQTLVPLKLLTTEEVEYQIEDLYCGPVANRTKENINLAFDLERQEDQLIWPFIQGAIGAFDLTNADLSKRSFNLHSSIRTENLPTTNLLTPSTKGASSGWELECMIEIMRYVLKWRGLLPDGDLQPTHVFIPSCHLAEGMIDKIALGLENNPLTEQLFRAGLITDVGSLAVELVPDPTLDPADGRAYVRFNQPVGMHYNKPSRDRLEMDETSYEARKRNKGRMYMQKPVGTAVPSSWRMRVAAVQYRDAA